MTHQGLRLRAGRDSTCLKFELSQQASHKQHCSDMRPSALHSLRVQSKEFTFKERSSWPACFHHGMHEDTIMSAGYTLTSIHLTQMCKSLQHENCLSLL